MLQVKGNTSTHLSNLIEFSKEFIQHVDQFSWGAVTGQPGEPHNVSIQDTVGTGASVCKFIFINKIMTVFPIKNV